MALGGGVSLPTIRQRFEVDAGSLIASAKKAAGGLGAAGKAIGAALAAGAATALTAGIMEGIEREALGDKLGARLNLSEAQVKKAGAAAGNVYSSGFGESMADVTDAVDAVASSLADVNDQGAVEGLTTKALALADVFGQDVTSSVSVAKTLIETGLARDATHAMDLITAGMQEIPAGLRDELGEATTEYSKFFADFGFTGEQTFALLSSADDRFSLDKTGDAIKELSIRATDMSTASVEAYEAAGLSADDMAADILAGGDRATGAFDKIVDGLLGIEDPTERANAAIGLFGTPIEDLGTAQIPAFLESLSGMGDGLTDVAGRADGLNSAYDNTQGRLTTFKRGIETTLASVVEMPGPLGTAAAGIGALGGAMAPLAPALTGVAVVFQSQLSSIVSTVSSATGKAIASAAKWTASTVASGAKAAASMAATAAKMVAQWIRVAAVSTAQAVRMAASWVIAMGPVGWVTAAIVGLVALIIANWDKVVGWTRKAWTWISDKVAQAWQAVKGATTGAVQAVVGWVTDMRDRVTGAVSSLWQRVVGFFRNLKADAIAIVSALVTGYVGFVLSLRDRVVGIASGIRDRVVAFFRGLKDGAIGQITALVDRVRGIKDTVLGFFSGAGSWLAQAGRNIVQGLIDGIGDMVGAIGRKVDSVVSAVTDRLPWSPAKKGPLRAKPPEAGGRNIGQAIADGIAGTARAVGAASDRVAAAASVSATPVPGTPAGRQAATSGAGGGMAFYGDIVLPNVTDRSTADHLLAGLRQAVRQGAHA